MATKTIGIDIREATGKGAGKGRYCEEITKALIKVAPKDTEFFLFTKEPNQFFPSTDRVKQISIKGGRLTWPFNLRKFLIQHKVDLFISPTSYTYPAIAAKSQKIATVIHDLVAFLYPKNNHWFSTLVERLTLSRALKNTDLIISVSENTWQDLKKIKDISESKKHVIATPAAKLQKTSTITMDLPQRFLLAVGTLQPRKNFETIFAAFEQIADFQSDLHLCIAGGKGWKTSKIFSAVPEKLRHRIHFLGYVEQEELIELYSRAQMLVFPSLYEGFGIPPLEAMTCACPVITSNVSSLPEVVGDAAIIIEPTDTRALSQAIKDLLGPQMQDSYKKRGLHQAKLFSWESSAKKILNS